jgi:glucose repression mediator protein
MHHQLQPPITTSNGKHALEDKKDHKLVKKASTSKRTPKAVEQDRSINSLVSAATSNTHNGAPPAGLHSSVAPPAHLVSAPITVPVPAPDVVTASPPIKVAEPTTGAVVESVVRSTSSEVAAPSVTANATGVAVTPVESASALTAVPATNNSATNQTDPVPQFSSNVNGNLEDPVELAVTEEPKAAPEVVEPPLRKVDEDENYDDE